MHSLRFDNGFNSACPSGNHMMEDSIWVKPVLEIKEIEDSCDDGQEHRYQDGMCRNCGKSQ